MHFQCQRSGRCCQHPKIVITLTQKDIWFLISYFDLETLLLLVQFVKFPEKDNDLNIEKVSKNDSLEGQLVLNLVQTTEGKGLFLLRKKSKEPDCCIFYDNKTHSCQIYTIRPQACRNFPFGLSIFQTRPVITWVKDSASFCPGIGKGPIWSEETLKKIGTRTRQVIDEYSNIIKEINLEAGRGKPLTPQEVLFLFYTIVQKEEMNREEDLTNVEGKEGH
ncbi:MAG: YkgJ family cysteine cluster protein [Candidatus Hodarchaeales archaeon]